MGADIAKDKLVAVGRRLGDAVGAGHAAGAADVLDDHLLAQDLGQSGVENARHDVRGTAGNIGHHHGQRPSRPVLGKALVRG